MLGKILAIVFMLELFLKIIAESTGEAMARLL